MKDAKDLGRELIFRWPLLLYATTRGNITSEWNGSMRNLYRVTFFFCPNLQASVVTGRVEPPPGEGHRTGRKGRVKGKAMGAHGILRHVRTGLRN